MSVLRNRFWQTMTIATAALVLAGLVGSSAASSVGPSLKQAAGKVGRNFLLPPLESRFKRADIGDPASLTGVISLGGSDGRVREAGRLARAYPHLRVVLSDDQSVIPLLGEGIEGSRITLEAQSRNTWENGRFLKDIIRPQPGERWLLITSAVHMPRAMGVFRKIGFDVEPWPVYDIGPKSDVLPIVTHEWLGLVGYWARGRSSVPFPGP